MFPAQTIVDYAQSIEWTQSYRDRLQRLSTEGEIALVCGHSHDEVYKVGFNLLYINYLSYQTLFITLVQLVKERMSIIT